MILLHCCHDLSGNYKFSSGDATYGDRCWPSSSREKVPFRRSINMPIMELAFDDPRSGIQTGTYQYHARNCRAPILGQAAVCKTWLPNPDHHRGGDRNWSSPFQFSLVIPFAQSFHISSTCEHIWAVGNRTGDFCYLLFLAHAHWFLSSYPLPQRQRESVQIPFQDPIVERGRQAWFSKPEGGKKAAFHQQRLGNQRERGNRMEKNKDQ